MANVPAEARVMNEEICGPIVAIGAFEDEVGVLGLANDHPAGLAAYLFISNLARRMRLGPALRAGIVGVNRGRVSCVGAPFGGVGHLGFGHSGAEGIAEFLVTHNLTMPAEGGIG